MKVKHSRPVFVALNLVGTVTTMGTGILLPRLMGKATYGEYAFASTVALSLHSFAYLWRPMSSAYCVAPLVGTAKPEEAAATFGAAGAAQALAIGLGVPVFAGVFAGYNPLGLGMGLIALALMTGALRAWANYSYQWFFARREMFYYAMESTGRAVLRLIGSVAGYRLGGLMGAVGGCLAAEAVLALAATPTLWRAGIFRRRPRLRARLRPHAVYVFNVYLLALLSEWFSSLAVLVLAGLIRHDEESEAKVGLFQLTVALAFFLQTPLTAWRTTFMPQLATAFHAGRVAEVRETFSLLVRGGLFASGAIAIGWAFFGPWVAGLLLGREYHDMGPLLIVSAFWLPFRWGREVLTATANVTSRPHAAMGICALGLAGVLLLQLLLTPLWGLRGAVLACVLSAVLEVALLMAYLGFVSRLRAGFVRGTALIALALAACVPALFPLGGPMSTGLAGAAVLTGFVVLSLATGCIRVRDLLRLLGRETG
jgi:O-antigen/teichoic acid export membrane protein